jgi:hypothetical protein
MAFRNTNAAPHVIIKYASYKIKKQRKQYVSFIICPFFRPISALIIPTPLFILFIYQDYVITE